MAGGLDPIGAGAEIDPVQIEGEDLLLGELGLQPHRQHQFLGLAPGGLGGGQEQVAGKLLGDGRAAPERAVLVGQVIEARPDDAPGVEAEVVVELAVLDGDEGRRDIGRQGVDIDRRRILASTDGQQRA